MEKFRWCFIGCGKLAHTIARQLNDSGRHEIVSVYTRRYDKAKEFASDFGGIAYESAIDAINRVEVDGVYISTTHNAHKRFAEIALRCKKPVMVEKAFTVYGEETEDLIRLAKENDTYMIEAMWTWFTPTPNKVKEWVDSKVIGNINNVDFKFRVMSINYAERVTDPRRAGGALLDLTVYPISYCYKLFGYPDDIIAKGIIKNGIDEENNITLKYDSFDVTMDVSLRDENRNEVLIISGDNGVITHPGFHCVNQASIKIDGKENEFRGDGEFINTYLDEFDTVAEEIRKGYKESKVIPLKQTLDVMHIMDSIREQIGLVYTELE